MDKKMMNLKEFREVYGIPENTVRDLIHARNFPAYKLGNRWYVDVPAFEAWREVEHKNNYTYA